jgi:Domain of unknown function (DUF222)/HNH endonuclease
MAALAESFIKHGGQAMTGGDRHQIVVHVNAETLHENAVGQCEIEEGPSLPAETARRLACDSSVVVLVENERGDPLNVGRKTRSIPPALRRALNARDRGCRFPGCTHTKYVDGHHVQHWSQGGETSAANLVSLCRFHHRKVHEGAVIVQALDDGAFRFVRPDGRAFDSPAPNRSGPHDWTQLPLQHQEAGIRINRHTAISRWRGGRVDIGTGVEVLLAKTQRAGEVPQRTPPAETH